MGKIIQAIKRFIWPEAADDKKQEEEVATTAEPIFSPRIQNLQRVYIRGRDSIVFECKNHPQLLEFKIVAENGNDAFADISYVKDTLYTRLNDGHYNADNGTVTVEKIEPWLILRWRLGNSVKLGNWKIVELSAKGKTTEKYTGANKWFEIWEKNNDAAAQGSYKVSLNRIETAWC